MTPCPADEYLVRFVDGSLSLEESETLRAHVAHCPRCRSHDAALRTLVADVKAAVPVRVDGAAHARSVMDRLDRLERLGQTEKRGARARRRWGLVGAASACACAALAGYLQVRVTRPTESWHARGGSGEATIGRDVGVQPYAARRELRPLASGATIAGNTPITAGFRNLGANPAFLLLFGVDAHGAVHWISPPYARPGDNPVSTTLLPTAKEQLLGTTAVLEDVSPGPLRIVAVITSAPAHVSDVEALAGTELDAPLLARRLAGAEVRETVVDLSDADGPTL